MSFFDFVKKMAQGKPIFEAQADAQNEHHDATDQSRPKRPIPKSIPVVVMEHVSCYERGPDMECWGFIRNNSNDAAFLDKVRILGAMRDIAYRLEPGEQREFQLYFGYRPRNTNHQVAELYFRNDQGDYFASVHDLDFQQLPDRSYMISRVRYLPPVRDI